MVSYGNAHLATEQDSIIIGLYLSEEKEVLAVCFVKSRVLFILVGPLVSPRDEVMSGHTDVS